MTSDRPYRRGMPEAAAIDELRRHAGRQFDPVCVDALVAALAAHAAGTPTPVAPAPLAIAAGVGGPERVPGAPPQAA